MKTLSKESFAKIQYVIQNQNYANIYARLVLELPSVDSALFSKILLRGDGAEWVVEDNRDYQPFSAATAEERELIAISLEERKASVLKKLGGLPFAKDLLTIPSENQIFFSKDNMGNVSVTLTQWGFKLPRSKDDIDIISALIAKPRVLVQSQVNVIVRYSDGLPAGNESFDLQLFGSTVPFKTNEDGRFNLGRLINGKPFAISDHKGNEKSFTVDPSIELYEVEFPIYTSYNIVVCNQEDTPCANFTLIVDGNPMTTDEKGFIKSDEFVLTPKMVVEAVHEETTHKETYTLARDPEENHFKFVYSEKFYSTLDVQVRYPDGEGLPKYRVKVGDEEHEADEYGHLHLEGLEADTIIRVADASDCVNYVDVELQRGDNATELIIKRPEVKMVRIHLQDKEGNPIRDLPIKLQRKKAEDLVGTTDADGNVLFPAELFADGQKIKLSCSYKGRYKLKRI